MYFIDSKDPHIWVLLMNAYAFDILLKYLPLFAISPQYNPNK